MWKATEVKETEIRVYIIYTRRQGPGVHIHLAVSSIDPKGGHSYVVKPGHHQNMKASHFHTTHPSLHLL